MEASIFKSEEILEEYNQLGAKLAEITVESDKQDFDRVADQYSPAGMAHATSEETLLAAFQKVYDTVGELSEVADLESQMQFELPGIQIQELEEL